MGLSEQNTFLNDSSLRVSLLCKYNIILKKSVGKNITKVGVMPSEVCYAEMAFSSGSLDA